MKRFFTILAVGLFLASGSAFATEDVLIDFTKLAGQSDPNDKTSPTLDPATTVDFSSQAGASFTDADKKHMKVSLAIANWDILLASSAQTTTNQSMTTVKAATVASDSKNLKKGQVVLGARIHFPEFAINSFAIIKPPFTIPAYATLLDPQTNKGTFVDETGKTITKKEPDGSDMSPDTNQFREYGIIKNVGVIKSIQINVLGRNYPNTLSILLENEQGQEQEIQFGSLKFDGWNSLSWSNPDYQSDVRNRELKVIPLYPRSVPFIKLKGIVIHHDGANDGGDFVTYIQDIRVIYDQALVARNTDVDDEALWNIIGDREANARKAEIKGLGAQQVLRVLENKKLATETGFDTDATAAPAAAPAAPAATKP